MVTGGYDGDFDVGTVYLGSAQLRRNPNDTPYTDYAGYRLNKLNNFNGDFVQAEMVKAFIESAEYRQRFGP